MTTKEAAQTAINIVKGNLLSQKVQIIVNPWNRNVIPWWLLLPQGVSGAIKRQGGYVPFIEVARHGPIRLGQAVLTSAGKLPYRGIIHVAGINLLWRASEKSIRTSVRNVYGIMRDHGFTSVAIPLIGSGSGGFSAEKARQFIYEEARSCSAGIETTIVQFAEKNK